MATKPLRSEDPNPKPVQFSHFGVLNTGGANKGATITAIVINVSLAAFIIILGMIVKNNPTVAKKVAELTLPPKPPVEQPKPKPPPPPPPKPLPKPPVVKLDPPKIVKMPEPVKLPPEIKPVVMPTPKPVVITPPAPKKVDPPPAPKVVNLGMAKAASIANNDAHPSAVRLGNTAVKNVGPAVATKVNMGGGVPGMPAGNTGNGPHAASVNLGSGSPQGTNLRGRDNAAVPVKGFNNGVPGGTGTGRSGPVSVAIAPAAVAVAPPAAAAIRTMATPPTLISRPQPVYTAEAKAAHVEGRVIVKLTVTASGGVQVLSATGLGHGLEEAATACMKASRWKPALDSTGHPIDYTLSTAVVFAMN
jgi:outer membrane biosynthesis protein TonB